MHSVIIGTAGHVDHGKTEIVKALTGRDTDRLAEEKQRGISIVLGFAPLDLADDLRAGIVDVPGHERFVKNMVSGAVGVDLALIVVAADEGVMPQTREHFEVLRLLGVGSGVIAVTKIDLVDGELADLVESEVRDLAKGSPLEGAPVVRTSVVTGEGLDALREALRDRAAAVREKEGSDIFRMPVDRVFTRSGIGTIITGTIWSGQVGKGDTLVLEPAGKKVRAREVHSFDAVLDKAGAGQRAALALHGVRVEDIRIGDQVLTPGMLEVSSMMDVSVEMSAIQGAKLVNRQRIRFHHAAGEIMARAVLLDADEIGPGSAGFVQLRLERRSVARRGDRFVIRSYSPMRVIGGGTVLDPSPSKAKRFKEQRISFLGTIAGGTDEEAAAAVLAREGAAGMAREKMVRYGFTVERGESLLAGLAASGRALAAQGRYIDLSSAGSMERLLVETVERFVDSNRLAWGIERETLRERIGIGDGPLFEQLLDKGRQEGRLFFKGSLVRAGAGELELDEGELSTLESIRERVAEGGFAFSTPAELKHVEKDDKRLQSFMRILQERGDVVKVLSHGYIDASRLERMLDELRTHFGAHGGVSVGQFKELFGLSRKYAVPLLEYLDHEGYTRRIDDERVPGPRMNDLPQREV
jgi:selenocysteine-specific elongation factor